MKTMKTLLMVVMVGVMASWSFGGLVYSTSFEASEGYTAGNTLEGQQAWFVPWGPTGNLVSADIAHSGSQSVDLLVGWRMTTHLITALTGYDADVVLWFYRPNANAGFGGPGLAEDGIDNFGEYMYVRPSGGTGDNYVIRVGPNGGGDADSGVASPVGAWTRLRVRYLWNVAGAKYWKYELFYGPEGSETALVTAANNYGFNWFVAPTSSILDAVSIYAAGSAEGGHTYVDDLSVTLIPEPVTLALLAVGGALSLVRRRR